MLELFQLSKTLEGSFFNWLLTWVLSLFCFGFYLFVCLFFPKHWSFNTSLELVFYFRLFKTNFAVQWKIHSVFWWYHLSIHPSTHPSIYLLEISLVTSLRLCDFYSRHCNKSRDPGMTQNLKSHCRNSACTPWAVYDWQGHIPTGRIKHLSNENGLWGTGQFRIFPGTA